MELAVTQMQHSAARAACRRTVGLHSSSTPTRQQPNQHQHQHAITVPRSSASSSPATAATPTLAERPVPLQPRPNAPVDGSQEASRLLSSYSASTSAPALMPMAPPRRPARVVPADPSESSNSTNTPSPASAPARRPLGGIQGGSAAMPVAGRPPRQAAQPNTQQRQQPAAKGTPGSPRSASPSPSPAAQHKPSRPRNKPARSAALSAHQRREKRRALDQQVLTRLKLRLYQAPLPAAAGRPAAHSPTVLGAAAASADVSGMGVPVPTLQGPPADDVDAPTALARGSRRRQSLTDRQGDSYSQAQAALDSQAQAPWVLGLPLRADTASGDEDMLWWSGWSPVMPDSTSETDSTDHATATATTLIGSAPPSKQDTAAGVGSMSRRRAGVQVGAGPALALALEEEVVTERLLELADAREQRRQERDLANPVVAAEKLQAACQELRVEAGLMASVTMRCGGALLLARPLELRARLTLLASVLQMSTIKEVMQLVISHPQLLSRPSTLMAQRFTALDALFKSRGLSLNVLARREPQLLLQQPGTLRNKLDAIPAALDLPPRRTRDIVARCPSLLCRSPTTVHQRYQVLQRLFDSVPRSFLSELLAQEPAVLALSAATLQAKFDWLMAKYSNFQDDVVDMILVDPNVLISARATQPGGTGSIKAGAPSNPKSKPAPSALSAAAAASAGAPSSPASASPGDQGAERPGRGDRQGSREGGADALVGVRVHDSAVGVAILVEAASELGLPLGKVLQLCRQPQTRALVGSWREAGAASASVSALAQALDMELSEARALVVKAPALLGLSRQQLEERCDALRELLQPSEPPTSSSSFAVASSGAIGATWAGAAARAGPPSSRPPAQALQTPSLLLLEPHQLRAQASELSAALGGLAPKRLAALLGSCPGLLSEAFSPGDSESDGEGEGVAAGPGRVARQVAAIAALLGDAPATLVSELLVREPRLLGEPLESLQATFEELATSFGSFREDALDVILADPSILLRKRGQGAGEGLGEAVVTTAMLEQGAVAAAQAAEMGADQGGRGEGPRQVGGSRKAKAGSGRQRQRREDAAAAQGLAPRGESQDDASPYSSVDGGEVGDEGGGVAASSGKRKSGKGKQGPKAKFVGRGGPDI